MAHIAVVAAKLGLKQPVVSLPSVSQYGESFLGSMWNEIEVSENVQNRVGVSPDGDENVQNLSDSVSSLGRLRCLGDQSYFELCSYCCGCYPSEWRHVLQFPACAGRRFMFKDFQLPCFLKLLIHAVVEGERENKLLDKVSCLKPQCQA